MSLGIWYWIILVIAVILGGVGIWQPTKVPGWGMSVALIVLLVILGIATFGGPVK